MIDIELPRLFPAQAEIASDAARFKVLSCGRRFGKTAIAIDILANRVFEGQAVAYFAPTYRMGSEVWREMKRIFYPVTKTINEHEWRLELYTGGTLECWSLANSSGETVRGRKYHYIVMDEAALIPVADVWHAAIRPLLTDYQGGALFASTPRSRNWFWSIFQQGQNPDFPEWRSWRLPTSANPFINASEITAAQQGIPERFFKQEYLAEFLDDGGMVFRGVDKVCTGAPIQDNAEDSLFFGVDWGKDNDYTCISVMMKGGRQIYLERFNQIGWAVQRGRLNQLYQRFRPTVILAEENSVGSVNIEALQAEGLPVRGFLTTGKSKTPLIDELALAMEKNEIVLLDDPILRHELMTYEMSKTAYGWQYSAPPGGHDDTVIATALSLYASRRYGGPFISWV